MSTTRLLVLGCVRIFQPVHGYDVRRELVSWHAEEWANVAPGSIYSALKTLVKDAMLEVVGTAQQGSRPERTMYKLTPRGEDEHKRLLHGAWWDVASLTDPLMAAVSFLTFTSRAEAIAALEHRVSVIRANLKHAAVRIATSDPRDEPDHVPEMMRLACARQASEIGWAEVFIAKLRAGEYTTADDPHWKSTPAKPAKAAKPKRKRKRA